MFIITNNYYCYYYYHYYYYYCYYSFTGREEPKVKVDAKDPEGVSALMHAATTSDFSIW